MRPSNAQYRRMDAEPGYTPHPEDQVDSDMEQAQLRLEQLRREKEEVENSRRRLEEIHMRKARFMDQQNELGDRMVNAADLISREVESLRQESNELEQIHMALTRNLKMLSTVRPDEWPIENTENLINQSQQVVDRCEEEFADAVQQCARMHHTKVLTGVRRSSKVRISAREFMTQFLQGLSFHLPLLLIALIILFFIWIFSPSASCIRDRPSAVPPNWQSWTAPPVKSSSAFRNWKPLSNAPPRRPACGWTATQCLRPTASGKATRTALCAPWWPATAAPRTCAGN